MDEFKTYEGWIRAGRNVKAGEKAEHYLVAPDDSASVAVFTRDQTQPSSAELHETWTKVVSADGRPRKRTEPAKPKAKVGYTTESGIVTVWCGPHQETIKLLKDEKNKFSYDPRTHRWYAKRDGIDRLCEVLTERGLNVEATYDGEPYDWAKAVV